MAATNREIDFTVLESFHLLFKNLWSMNIAYRVKMNIVDTILFKDGSPVLWIFTSEQTGEIMKKKDERLESIPEIVRALKLKSRSFTGSKDSTMRNKIATVWYMESERKVNSYIVDENELKSILSNSLTEILCVQTYTGGMCFRGNGIFEHRVWTQRDGAVKHITYENLNMERGCVDRFTCESEKMAITEHQHGSMCSMSNQLITHMGFMNKCKVGGLIIQVVFTEGWVPHLIAAKKITFSNVPQHMVDMREEVAYPTGKAPRAPVFSAGSLLLPISSPQRNMRKTSTLGDAPAPVGAPQQGASELAPSKETQPEQPSLPQGSMKVRSSSLSYLQSGSTKYTNFNVEQERKEAVAQRQLSASSEKYVSEAMAEVKAIAAAVEDTVFGGQADAGSSKVPFNKRGSSKFQSGGSSKGSSKVRHFSQSAKLPAVMGGVVDSAVGETKISTPEQSEVARESTARPAVHRGSLSSSAKMTKPQQLISNQTQAIGASDTGSTGLVAERFEKPLLRRAFTTSNLDKAPPEEGVTIQKPPLAPPVAAPRRGTDPSVDEEHSELQIPYIDPTKEPSRINYGAEDYFATVHLSNRPSTIHLLQAAKDGANRPAQVAPATQAESKRSKPSQKMAQTAPNAAILPVNTFETPVAGPGSPKRRTQTLSDTAAAEYPAAAKTAPIHRLFRPDSASSVTKLRQTMEKVKVAEGASSGLLNATATGRRNQAATSAAGDLQDTFQLRPFEISTEVRSAQTAFYKGQLDDHDAALKEQAKVFERRRPISAPHTTRPKHKVPPELLPPGDTDREYDDSGKPNLQRYHPKGFSLAKPLPLSGTLCFGTYCNFSKRAKNAAINENKEGAPPKLERCSECPHQVTYKSILLAKAEARFLGADIDENIESLIDQIRLTSVSTEQLYTYLVRRHLNRVAEKCQEEGRKMQMESSQAHTMQEQQADLNLVYRRLVYADALAHIHPSRFYYTVPLCEMCYKVYTFMDAQRETAILHNIDVHQQTLAAAAASAEKARFTVAAISADGTRRQTVMPGKMVRMPVESKHKSGQLADHHAAGHEGEDPYESDMLLDTDEFIPHHSAQRDIYNDQHKRDNFATTLRNNVATLQAASAEKARRLNRSPDAGSRSPSPPNSSTKVSNVTHSADAVEGHTAVTPPHSARRKVVLPRDRVPINHHDNGRFNDTSDSGIGSKGREHPHQVNNVARTAGTISSWVKLLRSSAEGAPANAQYDRTFGWRTNQEWDNQGNPKHLRPTSSSAIRLQSNRHVQSAQRPHSAQALQRQPSDGSSGYDSGPSAHVQFASGSQLQGSDSGALPTAEFTLNPYPGSSSRRRPSSAGAVPYPSNRKGHSKRAAARREEAVASLELKLANKMLELSDHLAENEHSHNANPYQQQDFAELGDDFADFSAAYAYSSLPFMAAPYLPAFKANTECVADAAYTQLQIDPASHRVIPPQPTPEQQKQLQLEQEQREIRHQLKAEKQRLRHEEEVQQRQLQEERDEIALRQRRRSSNLKPSPSTEFIPVSSRPHQHQEGDQTAPLWQQGGIVEDDAAFDAAMEEDEKLYGNQVQHREPMSEEELFHQQQHMLQLQQQREFRQLQHHQQLMHQKHQQQMLQQQIQFHERRRQEGEEVQHVLSDSQVLRELDIPSAGAEAHQYSEVPVRRGMDLRESVEMSPMSPPVFEFFQDASVTETDAFPVGAGADSSRGHQQDSDRSNSDDGGDENYESDEDFVHVDSGKSGLSDYDQTGRAASTESARRDESALVIDTTRKGSSVRFAGSDSFISPVEVDIERDRGGDLQTSVRGQKPDGRQDGVSSPFGDTPETASAKAHHRNIQQFASRSSDSPDADGLQEGAGAGGMLTLDVSGNEQSQSLSPCPEFAVPFPLARSPLAAKQSRAAEAFPSPGGESRRQSVEQMLQ